MFKLYVLFFLQLLKEDDGKKSPSFWTFEYYQQFFDVETRHVFQRVTGSMIPLPKRNYLELSIRPNPDLYGKSSVFKNYVLMKLYGFS